MAQKMTRYNVLHVKTTGAFPSRGAQVLEIAVLKIVDEQVTATWTALLQPEKAVSSKIKKVMGLSHTELETAVPLAKIATDFVAFLGDDVNVVAQARLEITRFLAAELATLKMELPGPVIDLQQLATSDFLPKGERYTFLNVANQLAIAYEPLRRAAFDVNVVWQIFCQLEQRQAMDQRDNVPVAKPVNLTKAEQYRLKLCAKPELLPELLQILTTDPCESVRICAQHKCTAEPATMTLEQAYAHVVQAKAYQNRVILAQFPQLPDTVIEQLVNDPTITVRKTIAAHPNLSPACVEKLAADVSERVCEQVIIHQAIAPLILATHPKATSQQLSQLVLHPESEVRLAVANHQEATVESLIQLAADCEQAIRWQAQKHLSTWQLTEAQLTKLLRQTLENHTLLAAISNHESPRVRQTLLRQKQLPLDKVVALLNDSHQEVASVAKQRAHELASHPQTTPANLAVLAVVDDTLIQQAVASHTQAPAEILTQLAQRQFNNFADLKIGKALAMNPQTPVATLLKLARVKSLRAKVYETLTKKR